MIFVINRAVAIKEFVHRVSVGIYEVQGNRRVLASEYDIVIDVQKYVNAENTDDGVRININGDGIMQELTQTIGALQYTAQVAKYLEGMEWLVQTEEEKNAAETEKLSD